MRCEYCRPESEVKEIEDNKSWHEFLDFVWNTAPESRHCFPDTDYVTERSYKEFDDYAKIGLLIEFLKTKQPEPETLHWSDIRYLTVDNLEELVKSLKPKEDGEIVRLANELYKAGGGNGKLDTPGGIEYWSDIAKRAIEIIKER